MAIDFLSMLNEQKKEQEEQQKVSKKQKKQSGTIEPEKEEKPEKAEEAKKEGYTYPFSLYTEGRTVDISNYGFVDGNEYTPEQICDIMLKHRHYEFAGEITFKMFDDDNTLVATAKQYKKG